MVIGVACVIVGVVAFAAVPAIGTASTVLRVGGIVLAGLGIGLVQFGLQGASTARPKHYLLWGALGLAAGAGGSLFLLARKAPVEDHFIYILLMVTGAWSIGIYLARRSRDPARPSNQP